MTDAPRSSASNETFREMHLQLGILVDASSKLLASLHVPDQKARHFTLPYDLGTAKKYLLSCSLMDVQTLVGAQLRLLEYLKSQADKPSPEGIHAIVESSIVAELSLWRRRLAEVLANLILFSQTNSDEHYYYYLLLHDLEENTRRVGSMLKDLGVASVTFGRRGEELRQRLDAVQIASAHWCAKPNSVQVAPAATIIRKALALAVPFEQSALGYSYLHSFSGPSGRIHFSTTSERTRGESIEREFASASVFTLAAAITSRVGNLAGLPCSINVGSLPVQPRPEFPDLGDFVVVVLDEDAVFLGETISVVAKTPLIASVRVRFVGEGPYADILEDEFPSDYIHPFLQRAALERDVLDRTRKLNIAKHDLDATLRATVLETWNVALRTWFRRGLQDSIAREHKRSQ